MQVLWRAHPGARAVREGVQLHAHVQPVLVPEVREEREGVGNKTAWVTQGSCMGSVGTCLITPSG